MKLGTKIKMCTGSFIKKQRCRDGVINDFLSRYRHVLVPLLFHEVTSLCERGARTVRQPVAVWCR